VRLPNEVAGRRRGRCEPAGGIAMDIVHQLIELIADNFFWFAILIIVLVSIVVFAIKDIIRTKAREASRREIAAYIAEGSMTPEQGERLMVAENSADRS